MKRTKQLVDSNADQPALKKGIPFNPLESVKSTRSQLAVVRVFTIEFTEAAAV